MMPGPEPSLADAIVSLRERGYTADFSVDGGLRCSVCGKEKLLMQSPTEPE